jgi:putative transposase
MASIVCLNDDQTTRLKDLYRHGASHEIRLRAQILLCLHSGLTWAIIAVALHTSTATIARWQKRFDEEGIDCILTRRRRAFNSLRQQLRSWIAPLVLKHTPGDFGLCRTRWACSAVAVVAEQKQGVCLSPETVRRMLHEEQMVWRRPRPVVRRQDPDRQRKLNRLRRFLRTLPENEVVVFQDEMELSTNPDIGSMWMKKGQQAEVVTPGTHQKVYLAGSLNWRTGKLLITYGQVGKGINQDLFIAHLEELRNVYRCYTKIHVICDNAKAHTGARVVEYLEDVEKRIQVHYLPTYSPETNPIERVWWLVREHVTRNHPYSKLHELLDKVTEYLIETEVFDIDSPFHRKLQ